MSFVVLQALLVYRLLMLTDEYDDSDVTLRPNGNEEQPTSDHVPEEHANRIMEHLGQSNCPPLCRKCGQIFPCETARRNAAQK